MIQLQIETTSTCNAKCGFCPYVSLGRAGKLMPMALFKKIMDEAAGIKLISMMCLNGLGEPTLDPMLVQRIAYAYSKRPDTVIDIFTNGVHMTPKRFEEVKAAGLSRLYISINASNAERHEAAMGLKGKYDLVCSHIDYAIAHKDRMKIFVVGVLSPEWSKKEVSDFYGRWGHHRYSGYGRLTVEGNWADMNRTTRSFQPNEACLRALTQFHVMADGRVSACCYDPDGQLVFGDLNHQSIREIYASEAYVAFRQAHYENKADTYGICKNCTRI